MITFVGGPLHREQTGKVAESLSAPDGNRYYAIELTFRNGRKKRYYVHGTIYSDREQLRRLLAEVEYNMSSLRPARPGYYWARWFPLPDELTIVDLFIGNQHFHRVIKGSRPSRATERHALWGLTPIPDPAINFLGMSNVDLQIAADWCDDHDFCRDAASFRQLNQQQERRSRLQRCSPTTPS